MQKRPFEGEEALFAKSASSPSFLPLGGKKFTHTSAKTFKKKEERCEQSENPQTVDLFWFIVGV